MPPKPTATEASAVPPRLRALVAAAWIATIVVATVGVARACTIDVRELAASLQDDSFYYLLSAWRAAHTDGVLTFDGEHTTYGVQPGFAAVLTALAWPATDRETYFRLAMSFAVVLHAATAQLLNRLVHGLLLRAGASATLAIAGGVVAAAAWLANLPVAFGSTTLKENVLYAPLLMLAWMCAQPLDQRPRAGRVGALLAAGIACRLSPSSLLSAVALSGAVLLQFAGARARVAAAGRLLGGGVLTAAPFLAYGHFVMGRLLPTSGTVKMAPLLADLRDGSYWRELPEHLAKVPTYLLACLRYAAGLPHDYFFVPQDPPPPHAAGFVIGPLSLLGLLWLWRRRSAMRAPARLATLLVLVALLGKAATCLLLSPWGDVGYLQWYVAGLPVLVMAMAGCAVGWLPVRGAALLGALATLAVLAQALLTALAMPSSFRADPRSWLRQMLVATATANVLLPQNSRIAASNSGALGYFAREDLVVVNVDGLANDDWFVATQAGCSMWDYLERQRIPYLCDVMPRYGWRENPFDSVRPIAVLPFVGTDHDGYFLLERQQARFPNYWPVVGVASRGSGADSPVVTVPWIPNEALPAWSPPGTLPGNGGSWANWRFDGPTKGAGLRLHLGGAYESVQVFVGGRGGVLDVLADGRTSTQVQCPATAWSKVVLATGDAGELVFEFTPSGDVADHGPLWLASCQCRERAAPASPKEAACEPFGTGCAERGAVPRLYAVGGVAPGGQLQLQIHAAPRQKGTLWLTIGSAPSRLSPIGAERPCYTWCGPQVVAVEPFVTGDDGLAVVPWTIPNATTGLRYVAQALLGKDTPNAAFSNGLRIDVP